MSRMSPSRQTTIARGKRTSRARVRGFSLVELMISLMLGLLVVGSAGAIFISNRQTYRATEALGRVQESSRMAYELFARDVRETGGNPCGRTQSLTFFNFQSVPDTTLKDRWTRGVFGYGPSTVTPGIPFGVVTGNRIAGTDAVDLISIDQTSALSVAQHSLGAAQFRLSTVDHSFAVGDNLVVCDNGRMAVYTVSAAQPGVTDTITVDNAGTQNFNPDVASGRASPIIARQSLMRWYVGRNANQNNSLFRVPIGAGGAVIDARRQEVAEGVDDLTLQYMVAGSGAYVGPAAIAADAWRSVSAVQAQINLTSADRAGVGGARLQRAIVHTATIRNRVP